MAGCYRRIERGSHGTPSAHGPWFRMNLFLRVDGLESVKVLVLNFDKQEPICAVSTLSRLGMETEL